MARILFSDRVLAVGQTGSGKSTFAAHVFSLMHVQRVMIDPKREWRLAGAVTVRSPAQLGQALERAPVIHYVPARATRVEWSEVYEVLFRHGGRQGRSLFVWTDEAYSVSTANWAPEDLLLIQTQGRALGIGHLVCTQRPRKIARELYTEAQHIVIFTPPLSVEDVKTIADEIGLTREELSHRLLELPDFGFLWYDRRAKLLTTCPPLPADLRKRAAATARNLAG